MEDGGGHEGGAGPPHESRQRLALPLRLGVPGHPGERLLHAAHRRLLGRHQPARVDVEALDAAPRLQMPGHENQNEEEERGRAAGRRSPPANARSPVDRRPSDPGSAKQQESQGIEEKVLDAEQAGDAVEHGPGRREYRAGPLAHLLEQRQRAERQQQVGRLVVGRARQDHQPGRNRAQEAGDRGGRDAERARHREVDEEHDERAHQHPAEAHPGEARREPIPEPGQEIRRAGRVDRQSELEGLAAAQGLRVLDPHRGVALEPDAVRPGGVRRGAPEEQAQRERQQEEEQADEDDPAARAARRRGAALGRSSPPAGGHPARLSVRGRGHGVAAQRRAS